MPSYELFGFSRSHLPNWISIHRILVAECNLVATAGMADVSTIVSISFCSIRCSFSNRQRDVLLVYGRWVAVCYDPDGFDIGRNMVHTGWALAYRRYSTEYVDTKDKARKAKRGMWKGEFVPPWEWRKAIN